MKVKKEGLTLVVGVSKRPADIVVGMSIKLKNIAPCCFKKLKNNCMQEAVAMRGTAQAAFAYALYEAVRDKLAGSGLEIFKTKVSDVDVNVINGMITIIWKTHGTISALRKSMSIAVSCLNPTKLFSKYAENYKLLTGNKASQVEYQPLAEEFAENIRKEILFTAVGKINITMAKVRDIVDFVVEKIPETDLHASALYHAKNRISADEVPTLFPHIVCKGLDAAVLVDYIRNNSNGINVEIANDRVVIYSKTWNTIHKNLKDSKKITNYITKKYSALEEKNELAAIFAYFTLAQGLCNTETIAQIIESGLKTTKLIEAIKKNL